MSWGQNSNNNSEMNTVRTEDEHNYCVQNHNEQRAIDCHWEMMPRQAKTFLLEMLDFLTLHNLAKFWSSPSVVEYTRRYISGRSGLSWFMALNYLKLGKAAEARALTLNGAFFDQCYHTPIETIVRLCGSNWNLPVQNFHKNVPLFARGWYSLRKLKTMEQYLHKCIPPEHQHMMASFVNNSDPRSVMNYAGQIGDVWSSSCPRSNQKPSFQTPEGTQIKLVLVDSANKEIRHGFDFVSSTNLKILFNAYAKERGVSLRLLRFSHRGKALFLSSVGNKTPDQLNLRDQDIITVLDTSRPEEITNCLNQKHKATTKKTTKAKNYRKKTNRKRKIKQNRHEKPMTLEEYKVRHSKMLSNLHDEMQCRLKEIRTRLNALDLERQPPKQKRKNMGKKKKSRMSPDLSTLPDSGLGAKAGKPYFAVQVGEVQDLYKTNKRPVPSSQNTSCSALKLDLRGCTKEEALGKLDESLKVWVDTAMQGSYPFVIGALIICGSGNQVLSEIVQEWIKTTRQVCNARKSSSSRS